MDANAFLSDVMQKTRLFTEKHFVGRRVVEKYPSVARFRFSSKKSEALSQAYILKVRQRTSRYD